MISVLRAASLFALSTTLTVAASTQSQFDIAGAAFYPPAVGGGSNLDDAGNGLGEPLNVSPTNSTYMHTYLTIKYNT